MDKVLTNYVSYYKLFRLILLLVSLPLVSQCAPSGQLSGKVNLTNDYDKIGLEIVLSRFPNGVENHLKKTSLKEGSFAFSDVEAGYYNLWLILDDNAPIDIPIFITNGFGVELVIDLDITTETPRLLAVNFAGKNKSHADIFNVKMVFDDKLNQYSSSLKNHKKEKGSVVGFKYPFEKLFESFNRLMDEDGIVSQYASALFVLNSDKIKQINSINTDSKDIIKTLYSKALSNIPPKSPFWKMEASGNAPLCRMASGLQSRVEAEKLFESIHENNEDQNVRFSALLELTKLSFIYSEKEKFNIRYGKLEEQRHELSSFIKTEMHMMRPDSRLKVGSSVPSFDIKLLDSDSSISSEQLEGKYYLLDFWGTWCSPCIEEMPYLHDAYKTFGGKKFEIISIAFRDSPEKLNKFRTKWKMPWKHVLVESSNEGIIYQFDVSHVPLGYLVSPEGKVVAAEFMLRGNALLKTLERVIPR